MITIPKDCCGCNACIQICPKGCITANTTREGFRYPITDATCCIDCGLCEQACPVLAPHPQRKPESVLAAVNPDKATRSQSSSGGFFSLLAEKVLKEGGLVFGAAFNDLWQVEQTGIEQPDQLDRLRRSKYVQSHTLDTFRTVERALKQGRPVLYSGTHCQIAGLKHFLRKDYPTLLTVDIVCHGVPSPGIWQRFLEEYKRRNKMSRIVSINFRDKSTGWRKYSFSIRYVSTKGRLQTLSIPYRKCAYMQGFLKNLYLRTSCHHCPAKEGRSGADLTISDYWNIRNTSPERDDNTGVSAVFIYSEKGQAWCRKVKADTFPITYEEATSDNGGFQQTISPHPYRDYFFGEIERGRSIDKTIKRCIRPNWIEKMMTRKQVDPRKKHMKIGIFTLPLHTNYGGILQAYALYATLQKMGHTPCMISKCTPPPLPPAWKAPFTYGLRKFKRWRGKKNLVVYKERNKQIIARHTQPFVDKYLPNQCGNHGIDGRQIRELDAVIVGSDQIWRPRYARPIERSFLDFTRKQPLRRIAYAVSFGSDTWEYTPEQTVRCAALAKQFTGISVREDKGVDLCRQHLGVEALHVLDPTLLLRAEDYKQLIGQKPTAASPGDMMAYILDATPEIRQEIQEIGARLHLTPFFANSETENQDLPAEERIQPPVEHWLQGFADASFIVTDSFHACVFSILFNKPFLVFGNPARGLSRIESLLKIFHLENRLVTPGQDLTGPIQQSIDWEQVNRILESERTKAMNFLKGALS